MTAYILTAALITVAALAVATRGNAATTSRSVEQRITWLDQRRAVHQYICRHGHHKTQRFHCLALGWTLRELREARAEKQKRDNRVPEPYLSIARCENRGNGAGGVNWTAYNSVYEGGYGFLHSTWRQYRLPWMPARADWATPREQTIVAQRLHATFGNYSSWPACHLKLGLT